MGRSLVPNERRKKNATMPDMNLAKLMGTDCLCYFYTCLFCWDFIIQKGLFVFIAFSRLNVCSLAPHFVYYFEKMMLVESGKN